MCNAVAAADLRAVCALAAASFWCQSGRTLSVVITDGDWAETEVVLLRAAFVGEIRPSILVPETREDIDDMAEVEPFRGFPDP